MGLNHFSTVTLHALYIDRVEEVRFESIHLTLVVLIAMHITLMTIITLSYGVQLRCISAANRLILFSHI